MQTLLIITYDNKKRKEKKKKGTYDTHEYGV